MFEISIVIPCYNESTRLPKTLNKIEKWMADQQVFEIELILINDGSEDDTIILMHNAKKKFEKKKLCIVKVLNFKHKGYINALFRGYRCCSKDVICNMEADCSIHPKNFEYFSSYLGDFDMIQGSRILKKNTKDSSNKALLRKLISSLFSFLFRFIFKCNIYDPQCGFKMIKKKYLLKYLKLIKLDHDGLKVTELTLRFFMNNHNIKEIPVKNYHDEDSRLVPKFSILNPIPFLKVLVTNLIALLKLYIIIKTEKY